MRRIVILGILTIMVFFIHGCSGPDNDEKTTQSSNREDTILEWNIEKSPLNGLPIADNNFIYNKTDDTEVVDLYVTVYPYTDNKTDKTYTLADLNNLREYHLTEEPIVEVLVREGDGKGILKENPAYQDTTSNGVMTVRGHSTRQAKFKSFKIKLYDRAGLWHEQQVINLNKHPFDTLRIRNKLGFNLLTLVPDITSMRTQFVHLYIKDLSKDKPDSKYIDYGLYTHVEQPNKMFLKSHGLDQNGNLYKAELFEFLLDERLKDVNDQGYKEEEFEQILEIKEGKSHTKIINMIKDVNNLDMDINDVVDKHFNRDNYLTWLAVNILLGNADTKNQNFMLYSPLNSLTWYFMPWDYDGAMNLDQYKYYKWTPYQQYGLANYWGITLHRRFFKDTRNVDQLNKKIEEVSSILSDKVIKEYVNDYEPIVKKYLFNLPDVGYLAGGAEDVLSELHALHKVVEQNKEKYYRNLERPMPVFMGHTIKNDSVIFNWDQSFDLQGDDIAYEFQLSRDKDFRDVIINQSNLTDNSFEVKMLKTGIYYWKIKIYDSKGNEQLPMETYEDEFGTRYYGVMSFKID